MLEQLGLGIVLTLEDNFTPQANTAMGSMQKLQSQAEVMTSGVKSSLDNLHHVMLSGFSLSTIGDDISKEGKKILNTFGQVTKGVAKTGKEFETIRSTMKVFFDDYQDAVKWGTQLASTTPFEIKDVMQSMVGFKAIGLDVRREVEAIGKAGEKMSKSLMEYIGDIGALRPDQGLQGALMAIRELAGGNTMSFKRRFDIDPSGILGRNFANASTDLEQFEKDLAELSAKLAPNLMGSLFGTMEQEVSNLKDSWEIFKLSIADAGAFDAIKKTIRTVATMFGKVDFESTGKAISDVITTLWTPLDLAVKGIGKLIQGVLKFVETFPGVSKAIGLFVGIYGVATTLGGGIMSLAGKFIVLGASITSAYLNYQMFTGTSVMATLTPLLGQVRGLAMMFGKLSLVIGGLALAWNTNFLGIRDVGVKVANEIGNRWSMANSIIENGLQNFKDMTLNDEQVASISAKYNIEFNSSNEATKFLDELQEKSMKIARPLAVLGSFWTALFGKKDENGLVIFSDEQIRALRDTGMLTVVQTLTALRGRVEAFFSGFKEGAKSFIGVMKEFMDFVLIPIKPLIEGVKKVLSPLIDGFKNLFGITDDNGMDLTKAEQQIALMEKLGKAVGFVVGAFAGFKVVKFLSGIITKPFGLLVKSANVAKSSVNGLINKLKGLNPFANTKLKITAQASVLGGGQPSYKTMNKDTTPGSRRTTGYNYVNPREFKGKNDVRLHGQDKTNIFAKSRMFGLGGQTLFTKQADGSMKNLGTRGGLFGKFRDKAKNFNAQKALIANGASYSEVSKYGSNTVARAKKSLGTKVGTLQDYYSPKASSKATGVVSGMSKDNKRNKGILNSYQNGRTIGGRKTYDGMWKDIEKDTGMYYSDFGKGKQGEIERQRFIDKYMKDKKKSIYSSSQLSSAYDQSYNGEMNNLLGDNAKYKDANLYKKKRSKIGSALFGDRYQVSETDSKGNSYMKTVARTDGIATKVGKATKNSAIGAVGRVRDGLNNSSLGQNVNSSKLGNLFNPGALQKSLISGVDKLESKTNLGRNNLNTSTIGQKINNSSLGKLVSGQQKVKDTKIGQTVRRVTGVVPNAINNNPYINGMRGELNNSRVGKSINNSRLGQSIQSNGLMGTMSNGIKNSSIGRGVGSIANNFKQTGVGKAVGNVVSNPFNAMRGAIANPMGTLGAVGTMGKNVWGATKSGASTIGKGVSKTTGMVGNAVLGKKTYGADGQYLGRKGGALGVAKKGVGMVGGMARGAMGALGAIAPWAMVGSMVGGAVKNVGANLDEDRKNELIGKSNAGELPIKLTAETSDFDMGLAHISDKVKNTNFGDAFKNLLSSGGQTFALLGDILKNTLVGLVQSAPEILSTIWDGLKTGADTLMTILPPIFTNLWEWITTDGITMLQTFLNDLTTVYFPQAVEWIKTKFSEAWTWITTDGVALLGTIGSFIMNDLVPMAVDFLGKAFNGVWNWITTDGITLLSGFVSWLVTDAIPGGIALIMEGFGKLWEWVKTDGIEALGNFFTWILTDGVPKMLEMAGELGSTLMNGIANAVSNLAGVLWGAVKSAFAGAIKFALPKVLEAPVLEALGLPTHHGGLFMSDNEHMALIRKDETVLPPDKSRQLDAMMKSGTGFNPVVSKGRSVDSSPNVPSDNSVSIQNLEIKLDARSLSRAEAREQALMIMDELKLINKERAIRQYS